MSNKLCIQIGMILLVSSLLLFGGYFLRKPKVNNTIMFVSPDAHVHSINKKHPIAVSQDKTFVLLGNVFHYNRGQTSVENTEVKQKLPNIPKKSGRFELTGIFKYQDTRGALIVAPMSRTNSPKHTPRRMYKLGDSLGEGYNLVEILDTQVVIANGNERITLQIKKKPDEKK